MKCKKRFLKVDKYEKKYQTKAPKDKITTKKWHGKTVKGIIVEETEDEWELESEEYDQVDNQAVSEVDRLGLQGGSEEKSALASSSYNHAAAVIHGDDANVVRRPSALSYVDSDDGDAEAADPEDAGEENKQSDEESEAAPMSSQESMQNIGLFGELTAGITTPNPKTKAKAKSKQAVKTPAKPAKGSSAKTKVAGRSSNKKASKKSTSPPRPSRPSDAGPASATKRRRTPAEMEEQDAAFVAEISDALQKVEDSVRNMPTAETELKTYCKDLLNPLGDVITAITAKTKSAKRRKQGDDSGAEQFEASLPFVTALKRVLSELASTNPNASELDSNMQEIEDGFALRFPVVAHLKRWKANILDHLRFNKYEEISMMLCPSSLEDLPASLAPK